MADPINPFLPDRGQQLGMLLSALGAGINSAEASGRSGWAGIGPGAAMYGNALAQWQQQQLERQQQGEVMDLRRRQFSLQEQELRDKQDTRALQVKGMAAWADANDPSKVPGMSSPAPRPTPGPGADYFTTTGSDESGGSYTVPNAKGSGAYGKYQFMPDTWADVATKNPDLGLPFNMKQATPEQQEAAMRALTASNATALRASGIAPTSDNLYLAHRFGVNGATTMLRADPSTPVSSLYPPTWTEQNPDMRGVTAGQFRSGVQQRYGGIAPPALEEIPRPTSLPPQIASYYANVVRAGAMKPQEAESEKQKIIDQMWNAQREAARTRYTTGADLYKFQRQQTAEQERHERGLATEGEWVRGADGVETFVPKSQRGAGMRRFDKAKDAGTEAGDIDILSKGGTGSREYLAAYNRVKSRLIDGPNGLKYAPDMSAYDAPTFSAGTAAPAGEGPAGLTPLGERSFTESQNRDHTYAQRLNEAIPQLEALVNDGKGGFSTAKLPSWSEQLASTSKYVPETRISPEAKEFRRIVKDIMTATLRRESGATIQDTEFVSEAQKFIPQPGDSPDVVRNKLRALRIAATSIAEATGRERKAYGNLFGERVAPSATRPGPIRIDLGGRAQ